MKARLEKLLAEYGKVALITYLVISVLTIIGFSVAIAIGYEPSSASGFFGVVAAGWVAAKVTMPLRILATLGLTPVIAALVRRVTKRSQPPGQPSAVDDQSAVDANADDQANAGK